MSISKWIDKQMWYTHTLEYHSLIKKEWSANTCYSMNEPWKYYSKWKKANTKGHVLYRVKYLEKANPWWQGEGYSCQELDTVGSGSSCLTGPGIPSGMMKILGK